MINKRKMIAFDFDGVIAQYSGYKGKNKAGEPIPEVIKAIRDLKKENYIIIIHSTRSEVFLKKYCIEYNIPIDYFNDNPQLHGESGKKPIAHVYVDDRALTYKGQNSITLIEQIKNFNTYWKK